MLDAISRTRPEDLAKMIDSTLLKPTARARDALELVREAASMGFHCAMLPPTLVEDARREAEELGVRLCSVTGFPSGMHPLKAKLAEVQHLASLGVVEVDVVPNLATGEDLEALVEGARQAGVKVVKVIVEAPIQDDASLARLVEAASRAGADYVKTSTGVYSKGGDYDTVHRLHMLAAPRGLRVKAAGGIRNGLQAILAIAAGASRIGTSSGAGVLRSYRELVGQA
ncbi:MAG: deoxyribose-phosphate aldolase [Desulfurococcales archaeon]|nr:deoxyribose-phosphate aldolase [Desulfurococcales archaeon]